MTLSQDIQKQENRKWVFIIVAAFALGVVLAKVAWLLILIGLGIYIMYQRKRQAQKHPGADS